MAFVAAHLAALKPEDPQAAALLASRLVRLSPCNSPTASWFAAFGHRSEDLRAYDCELWIDDNKIYIISPKYGRIDI